MGSSMSSKYAKSSLTKHGLLNEFSLCLSRACLGKKIYFNFNVNGTKRPFFAPHRPLVAGTCKVPETKFSRNKSNAERKAPGIKRRRRTVERQRRDDLPAGCVGGAAAAGVVGRLVVVICAVVGVVRERAEADVAALLQRSGTKVVARF